MRNDLSSSDVAEAFHRDGYVLVPQVFDPAELRQLAEHMFHVRQPSPGELAKFDANKFDLGGKQSLDEMTADELRQTGRFLRLHLFDAPTKRLLLDERLFRLVRMLWPGEPLATHALYFPKPPGGRGMALHSDVGYLPCDPPEMVGCLVAVDDADERNGALSVVRGSHRLGAISKRSIATDDFLFPEAFDQPSDTELVLLPMRAGDVLIFHGASLHSSQPNRSDDRWRRSFICHYISAAVRSVHEHFTPALRSTGEEVPLPTYASAANG